MSSLATISGTLERRKTSKWWYGRYQINGQRKAVNLHIEVMGTPPFSGERRGSHDYEKSKTKAECALNDLLSDINGNRKVEDLAQAVHEARTGRRIASYKLEDLSELWESMPRNKPVSGKHTKRCTDILDGFREWCLEHFPSIVNLDHLAPDHAFAFMDWQAKRGINPRTWNFILATLKTACKRGSCTAFDDIKQKPLETIHRVPFTPEELQAVLTAAQADDLVYPLVVTAACTAMRKGDCCRLRWDAVDLLSGYITVKTSKTGRTVDIPLADLLREVIKKQAGNRSEYVFPELAKQYDRDDTYLTKRFKRILAQAGFHDGIVTSQELKPYNHSELAKKAEGYFSGIPSDKKREKARAIFAAYTAGQTLCKSAESIGISKAAASLYLNEIEAEAGIAFIRGKRRKTINALPSRGRATVERNNGLLKASVRDFHALRTTWITLALMQGMPLELVQTVTGHATAEIVMEHYFKPQREQLKAAMQNCLPGLLTSKAEPFTPAERAIDVLSGISAGNWRQCADEVLEILGAPSK